MSKPKFLSILLIVFLCSIAANIAIWWWNSQLPFLQALDNIDKARNANVLVVGNSLLQIAFDSGAFQRAARRQSTNLVPVNTAISGTFPSEHYLMFKQAVRTLPIHIVIVGFYDYQLSMPHTASVADLFGDRAVVFDHRIPARDVESIYEFPFLEKVRFRLFREVPLLAYRATPWLSVALLRISLGGPFFDMDGHIEGQYKWMAAISADRPVHLDLPMEKIIGESQAHGFRLIFVQMPMSPQHSKTFNTQPGWHKYLGSLEDLLAQQRCGFIDASTWFLNQADFSDSIHLAPWRREDFSARLAGAVISELSAMQSQ